MSEEFCNWPMVFHGKNVRTVIDERDQSFWAHAGDVGELLGLSNIHTSLISIKSTWKRGIRSMDTTGRQQEMTFLSEQAIYKLAFSSRKPEAEEFTERVAELLTKLRRGELELRPRSQGLLEHTAPDQQKRNSNAYNRQVFAEGGQEAAKRQNAKICKFVSDKHLYPGQYKEWAKELGYLSKDRSSGQQVLRALEPWSACACSLAKNLLQLGMPEQDALILAEQQKAFYARLLKYATPPELTSDGGAAA